MKDIQNLSLGDLLLYETDDLTRQITVGKSHLDWFRDDPSSFRLVHSRIPITEDLIGELGGTVTEDGYILDGLLIIKSKVFLEQYAVYHSGGVDFIVYIDELQKLLTK